jgi:hypothetical protein
MQISQRLKTSSRIFNWNNQKSIVNMIADSLLIGGIAAAATFPDHIPDLESCWIAFKAFLIAFVAQLAFERGLKAIVKTEGST